MAFETSSRVERLFDQFGLGVGRPDHVARPVAVTESGPVENDDPVVLCRKINQTAGFEVLDHAAVAVQTEPAVRLSPVQRSEAERRSHRGSGRQMDCHAPLSSQDGD